MPVMYEQPSLLALCSSKEDYTTTTCAPNCVAKKQGRKTSLSSGELMYSFLRYLVLSMRMDPS